MSRNGFYRAFFVTLFMTICISQIHEAFANDSPQDPKSSLAVGFGISEITPIKPTPMAGYYGVRYSTATHDPLWAKATLLDDGSTKVAIIALDLISTNPWMVRETRKLIQEKLGIPPSHVMISATHSHTGPMLYDPDERLLERFGNQTDEAKQYMIGLPERIAQSVLDAAAKLKPRTVSFAIGEEKQLAFNRRFFMKDGSVGWNPGKLNPNIVREAGPTDDALPFVAFYDEPGKLAGLLSSFAIHLDTVGGSEWSADMPYTIQESLSKVFPDAHLQYATGTCGDINHIDVRSGNRQGGHHEAARIGTRLAASILRSWNSLQPATSYRLAASHRILRVPVFSHSAERSEWAKTVLAKMNSQPLPPFMEMVEAYRIADVEAHPDGFLDAEVQVISLGRQIAWVSLPGEIFVQLGLAIKDASPFAMTSLHELANGSVGYVPTRQAYAQGNYEVISARCGEGSGEMMVDSAIEQLRAQFNSKE